MRLRALLLLLVLTVGDLLLWNWSIASGHDIMSLVAGLTLLPLAAVSLGGLVLTGARLMGILLGSSSSPRVRARTRARGTSAIEQQPYPSAAESDSPSRLAA